MPAFFMKEYQMRFVGLVQKSKSDLNVFMKLVFPLLMELYQKKKVQLLQMFFNQSMFQNLLLSFWQLIPTHLIFEFKMDLYSFMQFQILKLALQIKLYKLQNQQMIQLSSSIVSTTITTCIVYPAERVKIQMHLNQQIKSVRQAIKRIIEREGLKGLYTGLSAEIFGNGLSYAMYFVAYAYAKKLFGFNPNSFLSISKCSGFAGCISAIATNPFWVLKTKQAERRVSIFRAGKDLIASQGLISLWKGLLASLILVSNPIIQFAIYQFIKKNSPIQKQSPLYDLIIFIIGAISKIIATLITYPYTLLRTKQHVNKKNDRTLWETFLHQLNVNGIKGLYTGINAKIFQSVLNSALLLMLYERTTIVLTRLINKQNN